MLHNARCEATRNLPPALGLRKQRRAPGRAQEPALEVHTYFAPPAFSPLLKAKLVLAATAVRGFGHEVSGQRHATNLESRNAT